MYTSLYIFGLKNYFALYISNKECLINIILDDSYQHVANQVSFSFLSNSLNKYVTMMKLTGELIVIALNPTTGALIEAKIVEFMSATSALISTCGGISDTMIFLSFNSYNGSSFNFHVEYVDLDTWETKSYSFDRQFTIYRYTKLFNTDQIIFLCDDDNSTTFFSLQTTYNRLDFVETFIE